MRAIIAVSPLVETAEVYSLPNVKDIVPVSVAETSGPYNQGGYRLTAEIRPERDVAEGSQSHVIFCGNHVVVLGDNIAIMGSYAIG